MTHRYLWLVLIVLSFISGIFGSFSFITLTGLEDNIFTENEVKTLAREEIQSKNSSRLRQDFTSGRRYTLVSPHEIIDNFVSGSPQILLDIRTESQYTAGHIIEAESVPKDQPTTQILEQAKEVVEQSESGAPVIIYDQATESYDTYLIADFLDQNGVEAQILSVGYTTFSAGSWNTTGVDLERVLIEGSEPGIFDRLNDETSICRPGYLICVPVE
jgi:rhodanese-related sulfurtransferase